MELQRGPLRRIGGVGIDGGESGGEVEAAIWVDGEKRGGSSEDPERIWSGGGEEEDGTAPLKFRVALFIYVIGLG